MGDETTVSSLSDGQLVSAIAQDHEDSLGLNMTDMLDLFPAGEGSPVWRPASLGSAVHENGSSSMDGMMLIPKSVPSSLPFGPVSSRSSETSLRPSSHDQQFEPTATGESALMPPLQPVSSTEQGATPNPLPTSQPVPPMVVPLASLTTMHSSTLPGRASHAAPQISRAPESSIGPIRTGVGKGSAVDSNPVRPCAGCRAAKVRCDRVEPCGRCTRLGLYCYPPEAVQRGRPSRQRVLMRALLAQQAQNDQGKGKPQVPHNDGGQSMGRINPEPQVHGGFFFSSDHLEDSVGSTGETALPRAPAHAPVEEKSTELSRSHLQAAAPASACPSDAPAASDIQPTQLSEANRADSTLLAKLGARPDATKSSVPGQPSKMRPEEERALAAAMEICQSNVPAQESSAAAKPKATLSSLPPFVSHFSRPASQAVLLSEPGAAAQRATMHAAHAAAQASTFPTGQGHGAHYGQPQLLGKCPPHMAMPSCTQVQQVAQEQTAAAQLAQQPAQQPTQHPVWHTMQQPAQQPTTQPKMQPMQQPMQQSMQQSTQQPAQHTQQMPQLPQSQQIIATSQHLKQPMDMQMGSLHAHMPTTQPPTRMMGGAMPSMQRTASAADFSRMATSALSGMGGLHRTMLDALPQPIFLRSAAGGLLYCNRALCSATLMPKDTWPEAWQVTFPYSSRHCLDPASGLLSTWAARADGLIVLYPCMQVTPQVAPLPHPHSNGEGYQEGEVDLPRGLVDQRSAPTLPQSTSSFRVLLQDSTGMSRTLLTTWRIPLWLAAGDSTTGQRAAVMYVGHSN